MQVVPPHRSEGTHSIFGLFFNPPRTDLHSPCHRLNTCRVWGGLSRKDRSFDGILCDGYRNCRCQRQYDPAAPFFRISPRGCGVWTNDIAYSQLPLLSRCPAFSHCYRSMQEMASKCCDVCESFLHTAPKGTFLLSHEMLKFVFTDLSWLMMRCTCFRAIDTI